MILRLMQSQIRNEPPHTEVHKLTKTRGGDDRTLWWKLKNWCGHHKIHEKKLKIGIYQKKNDPWGKKCKDFTRSL